MTRTEKLRKDRKWTQTEMAGFLNCDQATISRLENGQAEPGPVARLLDYLEKGSSALKVLVKKEKVA